MTPLVAVGLGLAGLGAGLSGSVAGLASLVSYPALLAVGLGPVTANVTNTVALVFGGVGSVHASRRELTGQRRRVARLCAIAVAGGISGAVLLLVTPAAAFARLVPFLIMAASALILVPRRPPVTAAGAAHAGPRWLPLAVFAVGIYSGYFGAAAGVVLLALFLAVGDGSFARPNAFKNVVLGASNLVAAVCFAVISDVDWAAAAPLAVGFLVGGRLGPALVRRLPAGLLRGFIGVAGLVVALVLALRGFGVG